MDDLASLYQEIILDHAQDPRHQGRLAGATHRAEGYNPLCGDKVTLEIKIEGDRVVEAAFSGQGCAISTASASLLANSLAGRTVAEVEALGRDVLGYLADDAPVDRAALGDVAALGGVRAYPMRVKCATLAWHTLRAALAGDPSNENKE